MCNSARPYPISARFVWEFREYFRRENEGANGRTNERNVGRFKRRTDIGKEERKDEWVHGAEGRIDG